MDIEAVLYDAEIPREFEPVAGECISIANAMQSVFGGTIVAVSREPNRRSIDHAAVRIDGTLYDGRGEVTEDQLVKEFSRGSAPTDRYVWTPGPGGTNHCKGDVYRAVKERLEETIEAGR